MVTALATIMVTATVADPITITLANPIANPIATSIAEASWWYTRAAAGKRAVILALYQKRT